MLTICPGAFLWPDMAIRNICNVKREIFIIFWNVVRISSTFCVIKCVYFDQNTIFVTYKSLSFALFWQFLRNFRKLTVKNTTKLENSYKPLRFLKNISATIYRSGLYIAKSIYFDLFPETITLRFVIGQEIFLRKGRSKFLVDVNWRGEV